MKRHIIKIDVAFLKGNRVYYALPTEDNTGIVLGYLIKDNNAIEYIVAWGNKVIGYHHENELSLDKVVV